MSTQSFRAAVDTKLRSPACASSSSYVRPRRFSAPRALVFHSSVDMTLTKLSAVATPVFGGGTATVLASHRQVGTPNCMAGVRHFPADGDRAGGQRRHEALTGQVDTKEFCSLRAQTVS